MTPRQARRRYLVIHGLRWLPTGLLMPIFVLLPLERGLSIGQVGLVTAAQGLVVLALELPTGGLADAAGRRPVLLAAGVVNLAALTLLATAASMPAFFAAFLLSGVFRALDSGPLESWYVDATLAADPDAPIERGLSAGGVVIGIAISAGALCGGGLVALDPVPGFSALAAPVLAALLLQVVHLVAVGILVVEPRPDGRRGGVPALVRAGREVPAVIGGGVRLLRRSRVLLALVAVELFWGFGMITFEALLPVRLSEVAGGADLAAMIMGPASSAAWLASSLGAVLVWPLARRTGVPLAAAALRVLQGGTVLGMALLAGPVGVLGAYLACYVTHGAANPLHQSLLHRQVDGPYRTTVVSLNSMVAQPAGALGAVVLGALAGATSVSLAMVVGAAVLAVAAPLYLPARRRRLHPHVQPDGHLPRDGVHPHQVAEVVD